MLPVGQTRHIGKKNKRGKNQTPWFCHWPSRQGESQPSPNTSSILQEPRQMLPPSSKRLRGQQAGMTSVQDLEPMIWLMKGRILIPIHMDPHLHSFEGLNGLASGPEVKKLTWNSFQGEVSETHKEELKLAITVYRSLCILF